MSIRLYFDTFQNRRTRSYFMSNDEHYHEQNTVRAEEEVVIFPEPLSVLELLEREMGNQTVASNDLWIRDYIGQLSSFTVPNEVSSEQKWYRKTKEGIDLRPGFALTSQEPYPIELALGDTNVHALIAGRTGSGKSVLLNTMLVSLLQEYAPWELDLYLVDMKQVEFSRYASNEQVPHLEAVAATSEVGYIVSLFQNIVQQMEARQRLFKWLGVQKLQDFREKYGVVLPRKLIVVDEFQQLFETQSGALRRELDFYLEKISRLGRSMGVHFIFASQDMSNTLSSNTLANFKLRFVLPSDSTVSSMLSNSSIGERLSIGQVFAYAGPDGISPFFEQEDNGVIVDVPFIPDQDIETPGKVKGFFSLLQELSDYESVWRKSVSFPKKDLKYFNESDIQDVSELEELLNQIAVAKKEHVLSQHKERTLDMWTLGENFQYSLKKNNLVPLFIERGRSKNVMIQSVNALDIAYIMKLIALNMKHTQLPYETRYRHFVYAHDLTVASYFSVEHYLEQDNNVFRSLPFTELKKIFERRKWLVNEFRNFQAKLLESEEKELQVTFTKRYLDAHVPGLLERNPKLLDDEEETEEEEGREEEAREEKEILNKIEADYNSIKDAKFRGLSDVQFIQKQFPLYVVWILGAENIEEARYDKSLLMSMEEGTTYNILYIFTSSSRKGYDNWSNLCDYFFVSGRDEMLYNRLNIPYAQRQNPELIFDVKHLSHDQHYSFKRFQFPKDQSEDLIFNYDDYLL